jgi:biopolymer transport protein ExbD
MTAMIDVAFQLLNFFIITLRPMDVFANLDISRPAPEKVLEKPPPENIELLTIMVFREGDKDGYSLQGTKVKIDELERQLMRLPSKDASIVIKCTGGSSHAALIRVLDTCAKARLTSIAVFSM